MGSAQAHLVQTVPAATNPTWSTNGGATDIACAIASFQPQVSTGTAKNEVAGSPDGEFAKVSAPLDAGLPSWLSSAVTTAVLDVGVADPPPIEPTREAITSFRLNGGFVRVPFRAILNPPQFTVEMLVLPEWPLADGKFHCVLESSIPGVAW